MKNENLFRAMGQVEDTLIQEAEETERLTVPAPAIPWRRWCVLAAALALVIGLGVFVRPVFQAGSSADSAAQNGEYAAEGAEAAEDIQEEATQEESVVGATEEPGDAYPGESPKECFPALTVTGPDGTATVEGEAFAEMVESENGEVDEESQSEDKENTDAVLQTVACGPEGALRLDFGEAWPEQMTVSWYQEDAWGAGTEAAYGEMVQDGVLVPPDSPDSQRVWVAQVVADWPQGGSTRYVFRVMPQA